MKSSGWKGPLEATPFSLLLEAGPNSQFQQAAQRLIQAVLKLLVDGCSSTSLGPDPGNHPPRDQFFPNIYSDFLCSSLCLLPLVLLLPISETSFIYITPVPNVISNYLHISCLFPGVYTALRHECLQDIKKLS